MSQRQDFVEAWVRGHWHPTELCARFGISRKTGYKRWHRYEAGGLAALVDQSRRPDRSPSALDAALGALLIRTRQAHPTWGPRKLLAYLIHRHPRYTGWPVASTVGALLKREGLVRARRRRPAPGHPGRPLTTSNAPNALWSADSKGQFKLGTGAYCYPLTVVDGYSRYLLACRGLESVATPSTRTVFEGLFRTNGLPDRIRTDNGAPFATCTLGRRTGFRGECYLCPRSVVLPMSSVCTRLPPNQRLLLSVARAPQPPPSIFGLVGGGLGRPPQQKRRSLGGPVLETRISDPA